jgi:hypothetical protein
MDDCQVGHIPKLGENKKKEKRKPDLIPHPQTQMRSQKKMRPEIHSISMGSKPRGTLPNVE